MSAYVAFPNVKKILKPKFWIVLQFIQTNYTSWYFKECSNGIIILCITYCELSFVSLINVNGRTRTTVGYDFCVHMCWHKYMYIYTHMYMYFIDARAHDLLRINDFCAKHSIRNNLKILLKYYFYQVFIHTSVYFVCFDKLEKLF